VWFKWFIHLLAHGLDRAVNAMPMLSVEYGPFTLPCVGIAYPGKGPPFLCGFLAAI